MELITDTVESIRQIPDIIEEIGADVPRYNILTPYPGTTFYEQLNFLGYFEKEENECLGLWK